MIKTNSTLFLQVSKFISNFFNPLTSLFIYFLYSTLRMHSWQETAFIFLPIFLMTIIPITGWIYWNVKKGKYTNADVSDRNQRKGLYFFIGAMISVYLLYDYFTNHSVDLTMLFLLILLATMQVSNYFIKSSMHTAFNVFVAALFFAVNPYLGFLWLGIAALVGFTRIILKRHTVAEVMMGALIATCISFIYLYTHIHLQK